jgi:phage baseplate assembly protein gpV
LAGASFLPVTSGGRAFCLLVLRFDLASCLLAQNRVMQEEKGRVYDAVIAVVTNIADPRKLARVRLTYPSLGMRDESDWTPVVMPGAGKDRGWFFVPEVGDEVLVMFEHGDMDRPVVIGALWNGKDTAPDKNGSGKNERVSFVSKSGSKVVLDDAEQCVTIEDGGGCGKIKVTEKAVTIEAAKGDVGFQAGGELAIVAGQITIKGIEVQFVSAGGGTKASGANITVHGSTVNIKGSQVDFQSGGAATAEKASGEVVEIPTSVGRSTASGSASTPASTPASASTPPVDPGKQTVPDQHSIEIAVLDALDRPAVGVAYDLKLPDGGTRSGTTNGEGKIKVSNIEKPGDCTLTFPAIDQQQVPPS